MNINVVSLFDSVIFTWLSVGSFSISIGSCFESVYSIVVILFSWLVSYVSIEPLNVASTFSVWLPINEHIIE